MATFPGFDIGSGGDSGLIVEGSIESIKNDVRIILDENEDISPLTGVQDPDTLQTDDITEAMITRAIDRVNMAAPLYMVTHVMQLIEKSKEELELSDEYCSRIELPREVLRVASAKATNWNKPVTEFLQETDDEYLQLRSKFAGVRASAEMPKAAITVNTEKGGIMLETYPVIPDGGKAYVRYISMAKVREGKVDNIDSRCYDAVLYMIASLYYVTLNEMNRAEAMEQQAADMLGIGTDNQKKTR